MNRTVTVNGYTIFYFNGTATVTVNGDQTYQWIDDDETDAFVSAENFVMHRG